MRTTRYILGACIALVFVMAATMPATVHAGVNDFTVTSFDADYYLSRQANGRSQLRIVEKISAVFPAYDQNHGLERAIPKSYDGHRVSPKVSSVTVNGHATPSSVRDGEGDNLVLRIGNADAYVHGTQNYRIEYTVADVTKRFVSHDELYWDANGTDWQQPFGQVSATLHVPHGIVEQLSGDVSCYQGVEDVESPCTVTQSEQKETYTFTSTRQLYAGENITFAVDFNQGTFAEYQQSLWEKIFPILVMVWFGGGAVVLILTSVYMAGAWRKFGKAPKGRGTLVAEYIPPKDLSVLASSTIANRPGPAMTAQIIDLCVRHYVKIYELEVTRQWFGGKKRSYELELVKIPSDLRREEHRVVTMLFGAGASVGKRVKMDNLKSQLAAKTLSLIKSVNKQLENGYYTNPAAQKKRFYIGGGITVGLGALLFNPGVLLSGLVVLVTTANMRPLTEQGVAARDYLKGLELYMKLAEADRLRLLQSPEAAAQVGGVDMVNKKQLIKLYERLLPYAILFGIEKDWAKQFAALSTDAPEWYAGSSNTFNAAIFASSFNNFTAATNTAFAPATSSGSSGSSGGGSSGGGGGGGGGGGW